MERATVKYSLQELLGIGFTLVVLGIGLGYGLQVTGDIRDDYVDGTANCNASDTHACGTVFNASDNAMTGVSEVTSKLGTIATVIVASVIIGILVTYLWARFARG